MADEDVLHNKVVVLNHLSGEMGVQNLDIPRESSFPPENQVVLEEPLPSDEQFVFGGFEEGVYELHKVLSISAGKGITSMHLEKATEALPHVLHSLWEIIVNDVYQKRGFLFLLKSG